MGKDYDALRLYGDGSGEYMQLTLAAAYEDQESNYAQEDFPEKLVFEEWSVSDNIKFLPDVGWVLSVIWEQTADAEIDETWYERLEDVLSVPEIRKMAGRLLRMMADRIDYYMADRQLGKVEVTMKDGEPMVGGRPLYTTFNRYRRTAIAEMADWESGFDMTGVSVSEVDRENGSPKPGDKIARNPENYRDRWLVAAEYFAQNFEALDEDS